MRDVTDNNSIGNYGITHVGVAMLMDWLAANTKLTHLRCVLYKGACREVYDQMGCGLRVGLGAMVC